MTGMLANQEIEQALIGAVLLDHRVLGSIIILTPEDFAFTNHQAIWEAIGKIHERGDIVNPVSVCNLLGPQLQDIGGPRYITGLASTPLGTLAAPHWARELRELTGKRRLVSLSLETKERAEAEPDVTAAELAANMISGAESVSADIAPRIKGLRDIRIAEALAMGKPMPCYTTGFDCINAAMGGGMFARRTYAIAARKKSGKTLLAGGISAHLNANGIKHLFVACEMGSDQIQHRQMARELNCNALAFIDPSWRARPDWQARVMALAMKTPDNTVYLDAPGITFEQLRRDVTNAIVVHKIKGFVLDYLQLVGGTPKGKSKAEHLDEISQWIAEVCKKHDLFSLVLAQINQDNGNIRGGEGIRLAFDQVYELKRAEAGDGAWLEMMDTRYTKWMQCGDAETPAFILEGGKVGPYFREVWRPTEERAA